MRSIRSSLKSRGSGEKMDNDNDSELQEDSVVRKFLITAVDGKKYQTKHYNLSAIIAIGYKVNSDRSVLKSAGKVSAQIAKAHALS